MLLAVIAVLAAVAHAYGRFIGTTRPTGLKTRVKPRSAAMEANMRLEGAREVPPGAREGRTTGARGTSNGCGATVQRMPVAATHTLTRFSLNFSMEHRPTHQHRAAVRAARATRGPLPTRSVQSLTVRAPSHGRHQLLLPQRKQELESRAAHNCNQQQQRRWG